MIRTCDGTDENLKREEVTRTTRAGQECMEWVPCDCGLSFDDVERLVIYPHHFIPNREDKAALLERVNQMVKDGKTAEEIRQALQLTSQPVGAMVESPTTTTTKGSSMDEQFGTGPTGEQDESTAVVSAEGTGSTADQEATDDALATEREGTADETPEEADARRARDAQNTGYSGSGF